MHLAGVVVFVHEFLRGIYGRRSVSKLDYYNYSMVYLDIISIIVKLFMCTFLFGHFFFVWSQLIDKVRLMNVGQNLAVKFLVRENWSLLATLQLENVSEASAVI